MKKLFSLLAAGLLLLTYAAPAAAAPSPDHNKNFDTWEIVCPDPLGTFTVTAKGTPGWPTDWAGYRTPFHFRGTEMLTVWAGGQVQVSFEIPAPPGLEPQLVECSYMHLLGGTQATFDMEFVNPLFSFPRPPA